MKAYCFITSCHQFLSITNCYETIPRIHSDTSASSIWPRCIKYVKSTNFIWVFIAGGLGVECDGPERGATSPVPLVASRSTWRSGCCIFRVRHRHSTNNRRSLCNMSGSKRLPCQKEACAIQKCLQGMTLILWILIFCSVLEKKK